jgi:hypothetical protein
VRNFTGTKRILPVAAAFGVLLIATLITVPLFMTHHGHGTNTRPNPATDPSPAPTGAVTLIQGSQSTNGVELGYPHTTIGAISAAADYLDAVASTLDPDYAATLMRAAGDPANTALPADLAQSAVLLRGDLQLPTSGPLPAPVVFQTTAQMYQLRNVGADSVLVLLLTTNTFINAQGGSAQTMGVYPVHMHWTGGDWRLASIGGTTQNYSGLAATPDTSAAVARGWLALLPATGGGS